MSNQTIQKVAEILLIAEKTGQACEPIRDSLTDQETEAAYLIQELNTKYFLKKGRQMVGRKIGLTSEAVQQQIGVNQPDYGILYEDMLRKDGEKINFSDVMQPKIEAEIAFVLKADLSKLVNTMDDIAAAIDYATPALEIVGSRIKNWDITLADTVADNGSSGLFVLGNSRCTLDHINLIECDMELKRSGEQVSVGNGSSCMGNPLNAVLWLANTMAKTAYPLRAGDIILSGALGPIVEVKPGETFEASISGLGSVRAVFSEIK